VRELPLLLPGQAVAATARGVGRISGVFRISGGLCFDVMLWYPGIALGLNLEGDDPREVPTGPDATLVARLGAEVFDLPAADEDAGMEVVGGGTVAEDAFHSRLRVPTTPGPLPDVLHVELAVPLLGLHLTWDVELTA
jgi:hypothetical protein